MINAFWWLITVVLVYNIYEMKCKKRSEISYEKIILELCYWYCWDAEVDERMNKRYQRYKKIAHKFLDRGFSL